MAEKENSEWPEIEEVISTKAKTLRLHGEKVSDRLEEGEFLQKLNETSYNRVTLPDILYKATSLEELEVTDTKLTWIDYDLTKLENLKKVDFSQNKVTIMSEWFNNLPNLKHMNLSHNLLTTVPEEFNIPPVEFLDLSYNQLFCVPDISPAKCLTTLILNNNAIEELPEGLMFCTKLKEINISNNNLEVVDAEYLKEITSLRVLDLSHNEISEFPALLSECRHIEQLKIIGNPIEDERLKEIESGDTKEILDYLATTTHE